MQSKENQTSFSSFLQNLLFVPGTPKQEKSVQQQIEHFQFNFNPVFNINQIKIQMRIAFVMNLSYLYIITQITNSKLELQEIWFINYFWIFGMSILNIVLILPKILLIIMLHLVIKKSHCIDELIMNGKLFIKSKLFIFNHAISKLILYGYIIGYIVCSANALLETPESEYLSSLIFYLQIVFTSRIIYSSIATNSDEKGLNEQQIKQILTKQSHYITQQEVNQINDCCSICVEDYISGEEVINLNCKHLFHTKCIQKWLPIQNKCPNCNQYIIKQL